MRDFHLLAGLSLGFVLTACTGGESRPKAEEPFGERKFAAATASLQFGQDCSLGGPASCLSGRCLASSDGALTCSKECKSNVECATAASSAQYRCVPLALSSSNETRFCVRSPVGGGRQ